MCIRDRNNNWKEALHFSQRERRGIFTFVVIIGIFLCIPPVLEKYSIPSAVDFSSFKLAIAKYEAAQLSSTSKIDLPSPSPFDPNTAPFEQLRSLGIAKPIAQRIIKYRKAGGFFYRKEDLKKIYGLEDSLYQHLQEYIHIASPKKIKRKHYAVKKAPIEQPLQPFKFDPNDINFQELKSMGLPPKVAQQLINYRNKGGSFQKKED